MNELEREKSRGLSLSYLIKVLFMRLGLGKRHHTPGFGLAAQLFSVVAKHVLAELGPERGEELLKKAIEEFGNERGRRIAETVRSRGKPLSLRNWIIYTDIAPENFAARPSFPEGDLQAKVGNCNFFNAAERWGLGEYAKIYCKYADYAILNGYNPDVTLLLEQRQWSGRDHCIFRYVMKEENKRRISGRD
ncbi:MAG TPA: L-2-amino-thiazoline-4-carboxylic acid hydrolase [Spirochaetota bacterium]|nr:L-2-amino-thiazoline-4-carboxylic acid hydrolase [Spirochaetota bacterium]